MKQLNRLVRLYSNTGYNYNKAMIHGLVSQHLKHILLGRSAAESESKK